MNDPRGSIWRKWDLHIHSKYSNETRAKLEIIEIFTGAIKNKIEVISVTDHSNFEALDEIWEIWEKGDIEIDGEKHKISDYIDFLPGIELKANSGKRGIHFLALFPKEYDRKKTSKEFLKTDFLAKIDCSDTDITQAGGGEYLKGLFEISVDFEKTCNKIHELNGIVIVHAGYEKDHSIEKEMAHHAYNASEDEILNSLGPKKEKFMNESIDICELTNWNEKSLKQRDFYLDNFKKPTIVFSDSHETYDGLKYTWIKAEPTIEGLKQIIYEPKHRVHIGENKPFNPTIYLQKANFNFPTTTMLNDEKFCFSKEFEIPFSPNFTCLIGGRGTGKSTVINLINEKISPGKNKFFQENRLVNSLDHQRISINDCVEIGGEVDENHIEFISQNEIEKFALDYEALTNAIYNRIKKNDSEGKLFELEKTIEECIIELEGHIDHVKGIDEQNKWLNEKHKELGTQKAIVDFYENEEYISKNNTIKELTREIQKINASKEKYLSLKESLAEVQKEYTIETVENDYDNEIIEIVNKLKELSEYAESRNFELIEELLHGKISDLDTAKNELSEYLKEKGVSEESLKDISSANANISRLEGEIERTKKSIEYINSSIEEYSNDVYITTGNDYQKEIESQIGTISATLDSIKSDYVKTISLHYDFDYEKANEEIFNDFKDAFSLELIEAHLTESFLKRILFAVEPKEVSGKDAVLEAIQSFPSQSAAKEWLNDIFTIDRNFVVYKLLITKHLTNTFKYKKIKVIYDGRKIEETSFGQRCTAALVILLQIGNNPIIIDEPEAHLDSLLISNYLVELIKEKKNHRQIIFATHNANFVINGDSELINILDMNDRKVTKIASTTIENKDTRERLIGLEGGRKAFENRENKYFN